MPLLDALNDTDRVNYYKGVCEAMLEAIYDDGVELKSYFPWSALLFVYFLSSLNTCAYWTFFLSRFPR